MSMSTLSLSHWTFSLVLPNPLKSQLKILPNNDYFYLCGSCASSLELSSEIRSNNLKNWDCELVIDLAACTKLSQQDAEELRADINRVLRSSHPQTQFNQSSKHSFKGT